MIWCEIPSFQKTLILTDPFWHSLTNIFAMKPRPGRVWLFKLSIFKCWNLQASMGGAKWPGSLGGRRLPLARRVVGLTHARLVSKVAQQKNDGSDLMFENFSGAHRAPYHLFPTKNEAWNPKGWWFIIFLGLLSSAGWHLVEEGDGVVNFTLWKPGVKARFSRTFWLFKPEK